MSFSWEFQVKNILGKISSIFTGEPINLHNKPENFEKLFSNK